MRRIIIIVLSITTLLLAGYAGLRGYRVWKQSNMLKLAREFIEKSDDRNAVLALRQVMRSRPNDPEPYRLMAELAEKARSPEAVLLRSRVVELAPGSIDDALALARTAIKLNDSATASNALEKLPEAGRNSAKYHNLAGTLAIMSSQLAPAESHFQAAFKLEPTNRLHQLTLSIIQLQLTNASAQAEARAVLSELSNDPAVSCQALRELINDAARRGRTNDIEGLVSRLVAQTNSAFSDKLLQLDLLRHRNDPVFQARLAAAQSEAASEPGKIHELATWKMGRNGPADALAWMTTLPLEVQTNQPVAMLSADCRSALGDWQGLQSSLEQQNWGELEFMRRAFVARALRSQNLASSFKSEWELALKDAKGQKQRLALLLRFASQWNYPNEQEQILWTFVNQIPNEKWAPQALALLLHSRGSTQGLLTLFSQLSRTNPSDTSAKNNLAASALLLDAQQIKPHELALEVYQKVPTNAAYASTYAFSLYVQGKRQEALKILDQLSPGQLEHPSIAAYYGILLSAAGDSQKANKYLAIAENNTLLPEERRLVERAKAGGL
jgi:Flp pilus assembly protein TadD